MYEPDIEAITRELDYCKKHNHYFEGRECDKCKADVLKMLHEDEKIDDKNENYMKNKFLQIIVIAIIAFFLGYHFGIGNQYSRYGDTGLPKNCRALITENLSGFARGDYTAEDALYSIDRNCGPNGYIWNER